MQPLAVVVFLALALDHLGEKVAVFYLVVAILIACLEPDTGDGEWQGYETWQRRL